MSELLDNATKRKELLKHMILQLHEGKAPEAVRAQLIRLLGSVPYNDVVEVEQELINEGLPQEEVLRLCDIHTAALDGRIDQSGAKTAPVGHPVHTFQQENLALLREIRSLEVLFEQLKKRGQNDPSPVWIEIHSHFNALMDVEKHYLRKEYLLFPFLEKHEITGPPTVMWGKHDETRELLKAAQEGFAAAGDSEAEELQAVVEMVFKPAAKAVEDMISKEEEILFPMCLDKLEDVEWLEIAEQSIEYGYCLYDPQTEWRPEGLDHKETDLVSVQKIQLPSGSFSVSELELLLKNIPFDMTFVDKQDRVRYFTQGRERIFSRSRAILGRKVQQCHPPSSVDIVEKILDDFKAGREQHAAFWITMGGRFIHIEYFALQSRSGEYIGTLEVSQDLTEKRQLEGEQRLLQYSPKVS
jgi:DUF438 domain-containing protein